MSTKLVAPLSSGVKGHIVQVLILLSFVLLGLITLHNERKICIRGDLATAFAHLNHNDGLLKILFEFPFGFVVHLFWVFVDKEFIELLLGLIIVPPLVFVLFVPTLSARVDFLPFAVVVVVTAIILMVILVSVLATLLAFGFPFWS